MRFAWSALVVLGLLLSLTSSAAARAPTASSKAEVKSLVAEAKAATKEERFADAVAALRRADELDPSAERKLELVRALARWGKLGEAVDLARAVASASEKAKSPKAKAAGKAAEKLAADLDAKIPRVEVVVSGAGGKSVQITLNGKPAGSGEIIVDPGDVLVAAEAKGFYRVAKKVKVAPGDRQRVELKLKPTK